MLHRLSPHKVVVGGAPAEVLELNGQKVVYSVAVPWTVVVTTVTPVVTATSEHESSAHRVRVTTVEEGRKAGRTPVLLTGRAVVLGEAVVLSSRVETAGVTASEEALVVRAKGNGTVTVEVTVRVYTASTITVAVAVARSRFTFSGTSSPSGYTLIHSVVYTVEA